MGGWNICPLVPIPHWKRITPKENNAPAFLGCICSLLEQVPPGEGDGVEISVPLGWN